MKKTLIGVIGGGEDAPPAAIAEARILGSLIARQGWVLLNGGRRVGVMDASAQGASEVGGLTVGLLPEDHAHNASTYLDIPIVTGLHSARNNLIALSSAVVIACSGGAGTLSEIALSLKAGKTVILMGFELGREFHDAAHGRLLYAADARAAVALAQQVLDKA